MRIYRLLAYRVDFMVRFRFNTVISEKVRDRIEVRTGLRVSEGLRNKRATHALRVSRRNGSGNALEAH